MKAIKNFFCACFLLCSFASLAQEKPTERTTVSLYFLPGDNRPMIQGKMNGLLVCNLCVDTGSTISFLTETTAKKLFLTPQPAIGDDNQPIVTPYSNGKTAEFVGVNRVEIGTLTLARCGFILIPDNLFHNIFGETIDGMLGTNVLTNLAMLIDNEKAEITFWKSGNVTDLQRIAVGMGKAAPLPLIPREELMTLPVRFNGQTENLTIDTGAQGTSVPAEFARRLALPPAKQSLKETSLYSTVTLETINVGTVAVGDNVLKDVPIHYSKEQIPRLSSVLGMDVVSKFRVLLDFPQKRLYLQPVQSKTETSAPRVGIGLNMNLTKDKKIIVKEVTAGAPADEAGMKVGDEIVAINGKSVSSLTLQEFSQEISQQEGAKVVFTIQRMGEEKPREVTLTVRKLP
jgi:predicted aspartyl protease